MAQQGRGKFYETDIDSPCERRHLLIDSAYKISRFKDILVRWTSLRTETSLPTKSDFSPHAFDRSVLPYIILLDVERDPLRFRYRLTGTMAESIQNYNYTGSYVDEQAPQKLREYLQSDLEALVQSGEPQHVSLSFTNTKGYPRHLQVLRLPLCNNNKQSENQVDHILVIILFNDADKPNLI